MGIFARSTNGSDIMAFPINKDTVIGIQTDLMCGKYNTIHAGDDGVITFTFMDDTTLAVTVLNGMDFGITEDVKSLTSTTEVWVS